MGRVQAAKLRWRRLGNRLRRGARRPSSPSSPVEADGPTATLGAVIYRETLYVGWTAAAASPDAAKRLAPARPCFHKRRARTDGRRAQRIAARSSCTVAECASWRANVCPRCSGTAIEDAVPRNASECRACPNSIPAAQEQHGGERCAESHRLGAAIEIQFSPWCRP